MMGNFGIKWLMIIGLSAFCTGYTIDDNIRTAELEKKVDEVVIVPTELLPKIKLVDNQYLQMVYLIQQNGVPSLSAPTDSPFTNISVCVISKDELDELANVIADSGKDADNPAITVDLQSHCSELERIKFEILKLKNAFKEITKNQAFSVKYEELKADYEEKLRNFRKKMDETIKNAAEHEKTIVNELRTLLQSQEERINEILKKLEEKQKELDDTNVRLASSLLINGDIKTALESYYKLSDKTRIREVIEGAYETGDRFQTLFGFIRVTDDSVSLLNGYTTLFNQMESKNDKRGVNLLILTNAVGKNKEPEFNDLLVQLEKALAEMHRNKNYDTLYNYQRQKTADENYEYGNEVMPLFVRTAYNNDVSNVVSILDLCPKFGVMLHRLYLLKSLITEMKNCGHTNKPELLIVMNDLINIRREVYKKDDEFDMEFVDQVYENVPEHLRPLMYKNFCFKQRADEYNQYYIAVGSQASSQQRYVLSSVYFNGVMLDAKFLDRGRKILLRSALYNQHFYVSGDGGIPRNVYTWGGGSLENDNSAHFTIEAVDDQHVRIKNLKYNEYLFSGKQYVHSSSETGASSVWKLVTCQLPI